MLRYVKLFVFSLIFLGCEPGEREWRDPSEPYYDDDGAILAPDKGRPDTGGPITIVDDSGTVIPIGPGTGHPTTPIEPVVDSSKPKTDSGGTKPVADAGTPVTPTPTPPDAGAPTTPVTPPPGATTIFTKDGKVYDHCGEEIIMLGVNTPTAFEDQNGDAFPEVAKTGANTIRIFWYGTNSQLTTARADALIKRTIDLQMYPMLEFHDITGKWNLDTVVNAWLKPDYQALVKKYEKFLMVNIANEATVPNEDKTVFQRDYIAAVQKLRNAGIKNVLIIDGSTWGRNWRILEQTGEAILAADPLHNIVFSAHLYDVIPSQWADGKTYTEIYNAMKAKKLPFIVGEFANKTPPGCGAPIDYKKLIGEAKAAGIGHLAWSWGNAWEVKGDPVRSAWNGDCFEFDMTTTDKYDTLFGWGLEVAVTDPASIKNTAKKPYSLLNGGNCKPK